MTDIEISIVVPCYAPHLKYLDVTFNDICNQTVFPKEVILAASQIDDETKNNLYQKFIDLFSSNRIDFKIVSTINVQYPGINRNMGAKVSTGDYIMFIDADDSIHPKKIEITKYFLQLYNPNIFLHSLVLSKSLDYFKNFNLDYKNSLIFENDQIFTDTFGNPPNRNRKRELNSRKGGHSIGAKSKNKIYLQVTHGYATVKRSLFEKFHYTNLRMGEDGVFVRDILWNAGGIIYAVIPLLNYRPIRNAV